MTESKPTTVRSEPEPTFDARDQRDGGWSWVQHEIYTVFLPIIGREATHLYQVMTFLIPERMRNPIFDLTVRKIAEVSGMGKSTVQRELKVLQRVGLLHLTSTEPPMFVLASLRKLAKLGTEELKRRLVPQGDIEKGGTGSTSEPERRAAGPRSRTGVADARLGGPTPQETAEASPAASDGRLVPQWDSDADSREAVQNPQNMEQSCPTVGHGVPQEAVFVPEKGGFCPSGGTAYIEVSRQKQVHSESQGTPPFGASANKTFPPEGDQARWLAFIAELRHGMYDVPLGVEIAKGWDPVEEGQHDFKTCFSAWWLVGVSPGPTGTIFLTDAHDEAKTQAGIVKYRKRLTRLVRKHFELEADEQVNFRVSPAPARDADDGIDEPDDPEPEIRQTNGEIPDGDRQAWEEVQRQASEHLLRMAQANAGVKPEWIGQAIEPAQLEAVEIANGRRRWKLRTPRPDALRFVLALLEEPLLRKQVPGVELEVLDDDESP